MRSALVTLLLLLVAAAPATRPAAATRPATAPVASRLIVEVRHVEYAPIPNQAALDLNTMEIPLDAREISSLQVLSDPGVPFETVAVVAGTRYSLSGTLKRAPTSGGKEYVRLDFEYRETSVKDPGSIMQISSNVMVQPGESLRIGGVNREPVAVALILIVKPPDAAPRQ